MPQVVQPDALDRDGVDYQSLDEVNLVELMTRSSPRPLESTDSTTTKSFTSYRNPIRVWDLGDGFTMMIGAKAAPIILEVGYIHGDTAVVIVHAMPGRERFLR